MRARHHYNLALILLALSCGAVVCAEELSGDEKQKVTALLKDLGAERYAVREKAQQDLLAMGGRVLPLIQTASAETIDTETKLRCDQLLALLSLEAETRPEELAKQAKALALKGDFKLASQYYTKTSKLFREAAAKAPNDDAKRVNVSQAEKAAERAKRATARLQTVAMQTEDGDTQEVIIRGGARARIRVVAGGGVIFSDNNVAEEDW